MTAATDVILLGWSTWWLIGLVASCALAAAILWFGVLLRSGRQGKAMVRTGARGRRVETGRLLVVPLLHELHWVDLTLKRIELAFRGDGALAARDGEPVELRACFVLRLLPDPASVLAACDHFGLARAGDETAVREAFTGSCQTALSDTLGQYTRDDLHGMQHQEKIRTQIAERLAGELTHGYAMDAVAVEFFEPVTPEQLADRDETG